MIKKTNQVKRKALITVFYDGKCGLCSKEIRYYRNIAEKDVFDWHDITKSAKPLLAEGVSYTNGLKILHVKDNNGKLLTGVDAFILIWSHLKYWKILAYIVSFPGIKQSAGVIYKLFANWRFKRLKHCKREEN